MRCLKSAVRARSSVLLRDCSLAYSAFTVSTSGLDFLQVARGLVAEDFLEQVAEHGMRGIW